jgi:hypothetical protein
MTRIRQAGTPVLVVTLIAGLIGYFIGCSRDQDVQIHAQEATTATDDSGQIETTSSRKPPSPRR